MNWAGGFHAPKGIKVEVVAEAVRAQSAPTPALLVSGSRRKSHVLHDEFWSEGDKVWATRARLDRARKIIGAIEETIIIGGKSIEVRMVEFVRDPKSGKGAWATMTDIMADRKLLDAYMAEVEAAQEQAAAKVSRVRMLLRG